MLKTTIIEIGVALLLIAGFCFCNSYAAEYGERSNWASGAGMFGFATIVWGVVVASYEVGLGLDRLLAAKKRTYKRLYKE